jgi:4-amino-4-deoxy-L-arabinose transferase-like glycosyltransferase
LENHLPSPPTPATARKTWLWLLVAALLLAFVALCVTSVRQKSATYDETHYLGAGNYLLKTHRWTAFDSLLHPVFWTVWHDLPLLAVPGPTNVWTELDGSVRGQKIMALRPDDAVLDACRFTLLPFAVALGLVVFRWSQKLYGDAGGLVSLVFYCFCPNLLAHAPLMTPDVTLSCFTVLTAWRLWELAKIPGGKNLLWAGAAMGFMLLSKFTALLLIPFLFATDAAFRAATGQFNWRSPRSLGRGLRHWLALLGIAWLLVLAAYGFQLGGFALPSDAWLTLPAAPYFQGACFQFLQSKSAHSFFLMGMHSSSGWWYYYLVAGLIKIPIAVLILFAGLAAARRRLGIPWRPDELYLLMPFVLLFIYLSIFNTIQNGFRYLLPAYPLLLVWLGNYGAVCRRSRGMRMAVGLLGVWMVAGTLLAWPNYLAYFNGFIGGSQNGYHWLGDSNVDWGQDLKELKRYMVRHGIDRIQLSYFGTADPAHYGIRYEYLPSPYSPLRPTPPLRAGEPPARFVALSAYQYQGIGFTNSDFYRSYYRYVPNDVVGGSILIFDLKALVPRTQAPWPLKLRQLFGLAGKDAPVDSAP